MTLLIDTHYHLWDRPGELETTRRAIERYGLARVVTSALFGGYYPSEEDIARANRAVYEAKRQVPQLEGYAYVNPQHERQAAEMVRRCLEEYGFIGVKLWVATRATDPRNFPVVEAAIGAGAPLLVHAWMKATGNLEHETTPMDLAVLAARYPEATFIQAHHGGDFVYGARAVRGLPNVYVDLSGSLAEYGSTETFVRCFGVERVLFGTDNLDVPFCLGKVRGTDLTPAEQDLILGGNAARLWGWGNG